MPSGVEQLLLDVTERCPIGFPPLRPVDELACRGRDEVLKPVDAGLGDGNVVSMRGQG